MSTTNPSQPFDRGFRHLGRKVDGETLYTRDDLAYVFAEALTGDTDTDYRMAFHYLLGRLGIASDFRCYTASNNAAEASQALRGNA